MCVCVSVCMCRRIDALVLQECINPRLWRAQREDTLHRQRDDSEKWMKVVFEENMMGLRVSEVSRLHKMMEARERDSSEQGKTNCAHREFVVSLVLGSWIFENQKREIVTFLRRILESSRNVGKSILRICTLFLTNINVVNNLEKSINIYE